MRYHSIDELRADPKVMEAARDAAAAGGTSIDTVLWAMLHVMNEYSSVQDATAIQEAIIQGLNKKKPKK